MKLNIILLIGLVCAAGFLSEIVCQIYSVPFEKVVQQVLKNWRNNGGLV